jgi:hypothetical protein
MLFRRNKDEKFLRLRVNDAQKLYERWMHYQEAVEREDYDSASEIYRDPLFSVFFYQIQKHLYRMENQSSGP